MSEAPEYANQELPERESMEFDVVIVGAGPAGLAAAIRLKQAIPSCPSLSSKRAGKSARIFFPALSLIRLALTSFCRAGARKRDTLSRRRLLPIISLCWGLRARCACRISRCRL